ncbi:MAG: hypothetical protein U1E77_09765 [Inhella sp.]
MALAQQLLPELSGRERADALCAQAAAQRAFGQLQDGLRAAIQARELFIELGDTEGRCQALVQTAAIWRATLASRRCAAACCRPWASPAPCWATTSLRCRRWKRPCS